MASKRKKKAAPPSPPPQKQEASETPLVPYSDPYTGEKLYTPTEQEAALAYLAAQEKEQELKGLGWRTTSEVAEKTGLKKSTIRQRLKRINPEEEHSFTAPLTGKKTTKKGAEWAYKNPTSQSAEYLIHPDLIEILQQGSEKERQLEKQGWKTIVDVAEETGLGKQAIRLRLKKINPEEEHSFTEPLTGKKITKKGTEWAYKNPNSKRAEYFLHPDLIKILRQEAEKERQLEKQGWKTVAKAAKETGLKVGTIRERLRTINPEEECSFTEPLTGNTITKTGSEWAYKNPNNQTAEYLIHPDLIEIYRQEGEKERQLEKQEWKTIANVAEETGLGIGMIRKRLERISPEEEHSFTEPSTGNTITKKRDGWVYQNPNNKSAEYFIHSTLVKIWRQEAEVKAEKKAKKGATSKKIGTLDEEKSPEVADEAAQKKKGRGHGK